MMLRESLAIGRQMLYLEQRLHFIKIRPIDVQANDLLRIKIILNIDL